MRTAYAAETAFFSLYSLLSKIEIQERQLEKAGGSFVGGNRIWLDEMLGFIS